LLPTDLEELLQPAAISTQIVTAAATLLLLRIM
jgi:hypothetical protein